MTYETISVRMNRSDHTIRWGFSVRQQADGLIIDRVEPESLSDKAGVKHNDKVEQINGRPTRGLDAATANRQINDSFNEVRLSLQRFVTSHTCLPWTLNEKDNKMVVEEMKPGFGSGFGSFGQSNNHFGSHFGTGSGVNERSTSSASNHQSSTFQSSHHHTSNSANNFHHNTNTLNQGHYGGGGFSPSSQQHNIPIRQTGASPAPFSTHQGYSAQQNNTSNNNNNVSSTTNYILPGGAANYNSTPAGFGSSGHTKSGNGAIPAAAPPSTYSYNNGATVQSYGQGAGGTPLNQLTFINTTPSTGGNLGSAAHAGGLSPSKVFYHSPGNRSRNELSPGASVHHLQYNSPMNLYSAEATAEQLYQQTGKAPDGPVPHDKTPAYLTSETRKLIEEEARGRFQRGKSPSSQSSCFKRISHAVGADN
uniref:PDZ domain-containing protein n=1 Tax=Caenorhabditis japonica TaxID=281687 RepID=A0A8R1E386_CAEJA